MGLIQKQSISGVIWSYVGVGLGFITTAVLFAKFLELEEIGLLRILISYSSILAMFGSLGMSNVTVKMFPQFRNDKQKHHGFLGIALLLVLMGFVLSALVYICLKDIILSGAEEKTGLFAEYFLAVVPLTLFAILFSLFDAYVRVLYNAVRGILYKEVVQRLFIIALIGLYFFKIIDFEQFVWGYIGANAVPVLLFFIALRLEKKLYLKPDWRFFGKNLRREMMSVGLFGVLASFSAVLVQSIDTIMIGKYVGLAEVGIYTISFFFGSLILVPMRTMSKIGSVVISDAWKQNDLKTISSIYSKSSLTLTVVGLLLFIGIWGNIDNVFELISDKYASGRMVIFFVALANISDVFMGLSNQVIVNSRYYRWLTYLLIAFSVAVVLTNYMLIPKYGIIGAAIATLVSKLFLNLLKHVFILWKFHMQPFSIKHLWVLLIAGGSWYLSTLMPTMPHYLIDMVLRSLLLSVLFLLPVYYLNISEEINTKADQILGWIGLRLR